MNKPKKPVEIKLSSEDVMEAITLYLNNRRFDDNLICTGVKKTRSPNFFLTASFK